MVGKVDSLGPDSGYVVELDATKQGANGGTYNPPASGWHAPGSGPNPTDLIRIFCRRDDYAFLPPGTVGGLPCDQPTVKTRDWFQIALGMWDQMAMPQIEIGMNPQLGMVAVPTWFWIDGYDGRTIPLTDTLLLPKEVCHTVIERDGRGDPERDGDGHVKSHQECQTLYDSMTVEIVAWPTNYAWDFGEGGQQVNCAGPGDCPAGLGAPYTDPSSESPIAHAYTWSSLGVGGAADAYTISVGITFGAHARFSINGAAVSDWRTLHERHVLASASHKVQEAQAVLTRP